MKQQNNKTRKAGIIKSFLFALFFCYFSYHIISGQKGLLHMASLKKELRYTRMTLDEKIARRTALESKVNMLYEHSLDKDLLDEQVRKMTNQIGRSELLIFR